MGQFNKMRTVLGYKAESTPYSAATLSNGDFDVRFNVESISVSPEIEMAAQMYADGKLGENCHIFGKSTGSFEASFPITPVSTASAGASLAVAPAWGPVLENCGLVGTVQTGTGYSWDTGESNTRNPGTWVLQYIDEGNPNSAAGLQITLAGAMSTLRLALDALGQPVAATIGPKGRMSVADVAAGSAIQPSGQTTVKAPGIASSTITAFGSAVDIATVELDYGITLAELPDPSTAECILGVNITQMVPRLRFNPSLKLNATDGFWTKWGAETTGAYSMSIGNNITVSAPSIQLINGFSSEDIEGNMRNPLEFSCNKNASSPSVRILQGAV